jgi:hypothetical protein
MRKSWLWLSLAAMVWLAPLVSFAQGKVGYPQQCTNSATNPTSAEWLTCTQARAGTSISNPLYTTPAGAAGSNTYVYDGSSWIQWRANTLANSISTALKYPGTMSFGYYFNGTTWDRTLGGALTDNLTQPAGFPYNASFLMVWDGAKWDRMTQPTGGTSGNSGDAISATQSGLYGVSLNHFYNGSNFKRWLGEAVDDSMTEAPVAPWVASYGVFRNLDGGPIGSQRMTGEGWDSTMSSSPTNLNTNAFGVFYNGTTNKGYYWSGEAAGDTIASTAPTVLNIGHFYNGSGYQRWKGEAWDADMATTTNPNVNAFGVFKDSSTSKNAQVGGEAWDADMAIVNAPSSLALNVYRDTTNSKNLWWTGENWDASMDITVAPSVNANTSFYNATASKGMWWNGITLADNLAAAPVAPFTISLGTFFNGTNNQRWTGAAAGADAVTNSTPAPWVANLNYGFNGTTWDRLYVIGTQADAQATTVNGLVTSSFLYGYNGSTFDMLRIGASNELQVTDVATRAGEDVANDWRKVKVDSINTSTPAKTAGTAVDSAGTDIVLASTQVIGYTNFCVYVKNLGGGGGAAFNNVQFQTSPDNTSWTADLGWTACDTSASGVTCVYCVSGNGYNYVRVVASTSASDTTADGWITLNKG